MSPLSSIPTAAEDAAAAPRVLGPRLIARGLDGADRAGLRGAARGAVTGVSLALGRGVHALLGAPEDGTIALAQLLCGQQRPQRGNVTIDGHAPWRSPAIRRRIAHLAETPELPEARHVLASMAVAFSASGRPSGAAAMTAALERIGAGALATRRLGSLTHGEARAVDLAIALASDDVSVLLLHEPFADVASTSDAAVEARLREMSTQGACVIVLTSSPRDAARLADDVLVLERGRLVRGAAAGAEGLLEPAPWPGARPRQTELVAHLARGTGRGSARDVSRQLSDHPAVTALTFEEPPLGVEAPAWVRLTGPDEAACALALMDAVLATSAELIALAPVPPTLHEVRSATEQLRVAAAWYARAHALPPAPQETVEHPFVAAASPEPLAVEARIEGHIEEARGVVPSAESLDRADATEAAPSGEGTTPREFDVSSAPAVGSAPPAPIGTSEPAPADEEPVS